MTAPTAECNGRNPALDAALAYLRAGLSVVPIKRDGSKAPAVGAGRSTRRGAH